jgi:hypothetical protein
MNFAATKDENLVVYYESVRQQVAADVRAGGRYRLIGDSVKQYATNYAKKWNGVGCSSHQLIGRADSAYWR